MRPRCSRRTALHRVQSRLDGTGHHQIRGPRSPLASGQRRRHARHLHSDQQQAVGQLPGQAHRRRDGGLESRQYPAVSFIQEPGPDNVLGVRKFNFPNRHAIYMHDTIQPELFSETERSLSHGCIRVRQPDRLATLLLAEDKGWSPQQVKDLLAKGKNSGVTLSKPVPVHLTYFTVVVDAQGKLQTFADIYGLDKKMAAALFGKSEALSTSAAANQVKRSAWNGQAASALFPACSVTGLCRIISPAEGPRPCRLRRGSPAPTRSARGRARPSPAPDRRASLLSDAGRSSQSREGANSALTPRAPISATISAAEKSRVAVPPA